MIRANFGRRYSNDKSWRQPHFDLLLNLSYTLVDIFCARTLKGCYMFEMGYVHNQLMHQLCSFSRAQSQDLSRRHSKIRQLVLVCDDFEYFIHKLCSISYKIYILLCLLVQTWVLSSRYLEK